MVDVRLTELSMGDRLYWGCIKLDSKVGQGDRIERSGLE